MLVTSRSWCSIIKRTKISGCYAHKQMELNRFLSLLSLNEETAANTKQEEPSEIKLPSWDRGGRTAQNSLTPLYSSIKTLIDSHPGSVCLVQVGSFYEMYFEQAELFGPKLGLKVATRKTNNCTISMAGFPVSQLQKFVKSLVQDVSVSVAVIDQYPDLKKTMDTLIHRKVSRIISPGTLVDESFINYNQNNYLAAIYLPPNCLKLPPDDDLPIGLSWIDLSVGEFYVQLTTLGELGSDISRINPSEIILPKEFQDKNLTQWFLDFQALRKYFIRYHNTIYLDLKLQFRTKIQVINKKVESFSTKETAAMSLALSYIRYNLPESDPQLDLPTQFWNERCLQMDPRTREALELTERSVGGHSGVTGTLLSTIRKTVTPSGNRLLTKWIKSPIMDLEELEKRHSLVEFFRVNSFLRISLRTQLSELGDFVRHLQRVVFRTGDMVYSLKLIAEGLFRLKQIESFLISEGLKKQNSHSLKSFLENFKVDTTLASEILDILDIPDGSEDKLENYEQSSDAHVDPLMNSEVKKEVSNLPISDSILQDDTAMQVSYDFFVRKDFTSQLLGAHEDLAKLLEEERNMLYTIKDRALEIDKKMVISKRSQHGRYFNVIHISGREKLVTQIEKLLHEDVREKRKGFLLLKPRDWNNLQYLIDEKVSMIRDIEKEIINKARQDVLDEALNIRHLCRMLDYLDVLCSFAVLAIENNLLCPKFVKSTSLNIKEGRHIVVESSLKQSGDMFIPNATSLNSLNKVWVISGPNMGGKSTFLRQNALIVIMAQIGCFVPASKASLGIVDKIFTRIGASDDLYSDLSTFMVEMVETCNILKNATPRSLAIVDEIGRGTSGKEGLAIAYATLLSLLNTRKCRTLFATHFGMELYGLLEKDKVDQKKIQFYRTKVMEEVRDQDERRILIDHELEPGISEKSFAIEIAKMAGFPENALKTAQRALKLISS